MTGQVLIVEDDNAVREALGQTLELSDFSPTLASSFIIAKDHISPDFEGIIVSDIRMPGRDGLHLLEYAQSKDADLPVILLTGEGDIPMAVDAMNRGAFDFLEKPCPTEDLLASVRRALKARSLVLDNRRLTAELAKGDAAARMIFGISDLANTLRDETRKIARIDGSVLIEGAPGSGVSKIAQVVHLLSARVDRPFMKRSSVDLRPEALADEIGALNGGTLFLDEIASLPPETQFVLLDILEEAQDVRILAGTTQDLKDLSTKALFNADLYYRLEGLRLRIPALKERPEDIPVLFRHYVVQACEQAGIPERIVGSQDIAQVLSQDWPGNARALMNAAMRFAIGLQATDEREDMGLAEKMAQIEGSLLIDALRRNGGNASATAEQLKLPRKTLYDKFSRHGIRPEDYRS